MDEQNDQKETVLHLSCKEGNKEIAQILLDHGASLYEVDTNHETPLHKEWVNLKKLSKVKGLQGYSSYNSIT